MLATEGLIRLVVKAEERILSTLPGGVQFVGNSHRNTDGRACVQDWTESTSDSMDAVKTQDWVMPLVWTFYSM